MMQSDEGGGGGGGEFSSAWSIYDNPHITHKYQILGNIGSGAYSDVYHAIRRQDGAHVALKEVHDDKSSSRELEALELLRDQPNVVQLLDYYWLSPGILLVLEFLPGSLSELIEEHKGSGLPHSKACTWMQQLLTGVAACHGVGVLHRDLKPSNLLIGRDGVLKLADFGTARILDNRCNGKVTDVDGKLEVTDFGANSWGQSQAWEGDGLPSRQTDIEKWLEDGATQASEVHASASYDRLEITEAGSFGTETSPRVSDGSWEEENDSNWRPSYPKEDTGGLTDCVGTRWYKAPELLYGSTDYSFGVDLWAVGCIFGEMLLGEPMFPGASDIDQLSRIVRVLGVPNETTWPGISQLPDYDKICFNDGRKPITVAKMLDRASGKARKLTERFLVYPPGSRVSVSDALGDDYFRADSGTGKVQGGASEEAVKAWLKGSN